MSKAYILLADGFETIEALTPIDVLRRCGVDIKSVSISGNLSVSSSHHVTVMADMTISDDILDGDMVILPGGYPGYVHLCESAAVGGVVRRYFESGKYVAAICAGPTVLAVNGIANGSTITCHFSAEEKMVSAGYNCTRADVEEDGKLITGIGAGLSLPFALKLAEKLATPEMLQKVMHGLELVR